jgi:heat shock protein HslJ
VLLDRRDTALATFSPQPAALTGTVWRVTGFADGHRGWAGLRRSSLVTVEFDPEGRVRGFGGCVPYGGTWNVVDRRLDVGPLRSAHADCDGFTDLWAQQQAYLASLGRATALRRDGDRLELLAGSGEVVATAEAMPRGGPIARR